MCVLHSFAPFLFPRRCAGWPRSLDTHKESAASQRCEEREVRAETEPAAVSFSIPMFINFSFSPLNVLLCFLFSFLSIFSHSHIFIFPFSSRLGRFLPPPSTESARGPRGVKVRRLCADSPLPSSLPTPLSHILSFLHSIHFRVPVALFTFFSSFRFFRSSLFFFPFVMPNHLLHSSHLIYHISGPAATSPTPFLFFLSIFPLSRVEDGEAKTSWAAKGRVSKPQCPCVM